MAKKPIILCVLDGWGWREDAQDNAVAHAHTPHWDQLWAEAPRAFLKTSGAAVGLPDGQMGNSEVGHMTLGAGRVVMQDLPRIDAAVKNGELSTLAPLQDFIATLKQSGGTAHLMGLLSPGGVHSHQRHILALAHALTDAGLPVAVHAFSDGRDTPPQSALDYVREFDAGLPKGASIATIGGRYFAMDRDKRWDRVRRGYEAIVKAEGLPATTAQAAIEEAYGRGETDEFIQPSIIGDYAGMAAQDGILMANFRADRAREVLTSLVDPAFDGFERPDLRPIAALGMVSYSDALDAYLTSLFPPQSIHDGFGEVVAAAGRTQLRLAETEKYPHVTFFFNGGVEAERTGETRLLIPSPKVATYDLQPEMSAHEVTDRLVEAIDSGDYDTIIVNYANPDMVGHTGVMPAAIRALETVDACLGRMIEALERTGGTAILTADHGNVELMVDPDTGAPHTAHTVFDVPVFLINGPTGQDIADGALSDIAPTLLALMGLAQPAAMTGRSLLDDAEQKDAAA